MTRKVVHNYLIHVLEKFQFFLTPKISSYETLRLLSVQLNSHCPIYILRDIAKIFTLVDDYSWIWVEYQSGHKLHDLGSHKFSNPWSQYTPSYRQNTIARPAENSQNREAKTEYFNHFNHCSSLGVEYQSGSKFPKLHAYKISTSLDVYSRSYGLNTEILFRKPEV